MALPTGRKKVLVFRELPPNQLARLQAQHDVTLANPRLPEQLTAFRAALATAEAPSARRPPCSMR